MGFEYYERVGVLIVFEGGGLNSMRGWGLNSMRGWGLNSMRGWGFESEDVMTCSCACSNTLSFYPTNQKLGNLY